MTGLGQGSAAAATVEVHACVVAGLAPSHAPSGSTAPVLPSTHVTARAAVCVPQSHRAHDPTCRRPRSR